MKALRVFSVYDAKVEAYCQPFFMGSKGQAHRSWVDVVNDPTTQFHKHPEDFTLFEIGEWDEDTADFKNHEANIPIGTALEVHKGYKEPQVAR